ncbi:NADP-dependent oxidoreductase [Thermobifida alba]
MEFGGPEKLQVVDIPEPHPGPGEVRIRVHAAAVNPTDTALRAGLRRLEWPPPHIPGMDAAGVVSEVGEGVSWQVGDRVMAVVTPVRPGGGAYADHIVVPAESVVRMPEGADFFAASTLLMNALTARLALDRLALEPGQTVAVTGAAGAFGGYAVQLAKADGLRVVADASEADEDLVRGLGADVVVRRGDDVADRIRAACPQGVDGLADGALLHDLVVPAVRDNGRMAVVRAWDGRPGRGIEVHRILVTEALKDTAALDRLRRQAEEGVLTLRVARVLPAEQAAEAHRLLEAGGVRGRLVLDFSS